MKIALWKKILYPLLGVAPGYFIDRGHPVWLFVVWSAWMALTWTMGETEEPKQ